MANLLQETIDVLKRNGKTTADVIYIQQPKVDACREKRSAAWITWPEFAAIADREYDDGIGGQEVNPELKVIGKDWWLERHECDGAEWWEFKQYPTREGENDASEIVIFGRYW